MNTVSGIKLILNNMRFFCCQVYISCGNHRQLDLVCGRIYEFSDFSQDIRASPEARTDTEPAGEIRGGLQE